MLKYIIGIAALGAVIIGYFLLALAGMAPEPTSQPAPDATAPVAPVAIVAQSEAPASPSEETMLEDMAAKARENLPSAVTDTLTLNDALFLPRMRIMEYNYVSTAADTRGAARDMRGLIETRAETICLEGRGMFEMGVTLRNSLEDRTGNVFQRVYLLPEDCQKYF